MNMMMIAITKETNCFYNFDSYNTSFFAKLLRK